MYPPRVGLGAIWRRFRGSGEVSGPFDVQAREVFVAGPLFLETYSAGPAESDVYTAGPLIADTDT